MTKKLISSIIAAVFSVALTGCVTQEYGSDATPVVKNQANRDDMAATRISLGLGYLRMGNMAQAKQNLEKAKKFAPNMVQVYTAFAHYYETVGEDELTISSYEKALSLKSDDADTLNNYRVYLCRQDQTEEAEKQKNSHKRKKINKLNAYTYPLVFYKKTTLKRLKCIFIKP